ncbi:MAG: 50S ribosomal protein L9 [Turneriella sp.]
MRVILKQDISTLGRAGDIKEVKDGYARNYLFPRGLVMSATVRSVKEKAFLENVQARKIAKRKKSAEELAAQLNGKEVTLQAKVGEDNKLFGSITNIQVAKQLESMGFAVDRRAIVLDDHIKALGNYKLQVKLHDGVNAQIVLHVVAG